MRHESITVSTLSMEPERISPTRGNTSSTWKACIGSAPALGLSASQRQPSLRSRRRKRTSSDSPMSVGLTLRSRPLPSQ